MTATIAGISPAFVPPSPSVTGASAKYQQSVNPSANPTGLPNWLVGYGTSVVAGLGVGVVSAGGSYGRYIEEVFQQENIEKKLATEGKPQWLSMKDTLELAKDVLEADAAGWADKLLIKNNRNEQITAQLPKASAPVYNLHVESLQDKKLAENVLPEFKTAVNERMIQTHTNHFKGFFKPWQNDSDELKKQGLKGLAVLSENSKNTGIWNGAWVFLIGLLAFSWADSSQYKTTQEKHEY